MKSRILIFAIILILIVGGGAFWYFRGDSSGGEQNKGEINAEDYPFTNPDLKARYNDKDHGFFVDYPESFTANAMDEGDVRIVVFDNKDAAKKDESFQIFIMPYDEPGPVTPERILIDEPKMVIKDPQTIELAGGEALIFFSSDPDIGDVREVWIVHPSTSSGQVGHLFQISTYAKNDELLSKVMATFKFK